MKKIICVIIAISLIVGLFIISGFGSSENTNVTVEDPSYYHHDFAGIELNVFNWGEYISEGGDGSLDVIAAFERQTGIKVNYTTYDSNESMYSKIESGSVSYDIIIPSDYMIARMRNEGLLKELDFSLIPNYKYIDDYYRNAYFDPENKFSVPYTAGMVGLIYNTKMVEEKPDSWGVMWDERYKGNILTFDNSRDAFAIAQFYLGIDVNTTNKTDWDKAAEKLKEQNPLLQGRVMDQVFNKMQGGNAAIAPYYAGDYLTMADINPDLSFVYPKEGTNIFVDSMCIPWNSKNYEAAHMFINFMLETEVALANAEYICYATPHNGVLEHEDYSLAGNEYLYPENLEEYNTTYYHDLDHDTKVYFEKLWEEVKNTKTQ